MKFLAVLALSLALSGCGYYRHDDGMGDLWKAVKIQQERNRK